MLHWMRVPRPNPLPGSGAASKHTSVNRSVQVVTEAKARLCPSVSQDIHLAQYAVA